MARFTFCLLLLMAAAPSICYAEVTKLSAEHRKALQNFSRFREISSVTELPPAVVSLCADNAGRLAEPKQKWQATDVISNIQLPRKRLIWAVTDGELYVVHYERGGRSHSFHILISTLPKGNVQSDVVWRAVGHPLKNYSAFLEALRNDQLDDRLNYAY